MANHISAEKRNRQRISRTARNRVVKGHVRSLLKQARIAVETGAEDAAAKVKLAARQLDRAASKSVLPRRRTARLKSRLARKLHRLTSS